MPNTMSSHEPNGDAEEPRSLLSWSERLAREDERDRQRAQRLPQSLRILQSRYFWWKVVYAFRQSAAMLPPLVIIQNPDTTYLVTSTLVCTAGTLLGSRETFGGGFFGVIELIKASVFGVPLLTIYMAINVAYSGYVWGVVYFFSLVGGWFILDGVAKKMLVLYVIAIMVALGAYKWRGVGPAHSLWYPCRLCLEIVIGAFIGSLSTLVPWPKLAQRRIDQKIEKAADLLSIAYGGLCDSFWTRSNMQRRVNIVKIQTIKRSAVTLLADAQVCLNESRFEPQTLDAYYLRLSKFQLISAMPALFDSTLRALSAVSDDPLLVQDSPHSNVFKQHMTGPMRDLADAVAEALALVGSSRDPADFSAHCMHHNKGGDHAHPLRKVKNALKRIDAALSRARRDVYYTTASANGRGAHPGPDDYHHPEGQATIRAFSLARDLAIAPPSPKLRKRMTNTATRDPYQSRQRSNSGVFIVGDDPLTTTALVSTPTTMGGAVDDDFAAHPDDVYQFISGVSGQELGALFAFHVFTITQVARKLVTFPIAVADRRRGRTLQLVLWEEVRDFLMTPYNCTKQLMAFLAFTACSVYYHLRRDGDVAAASSASPASPTIPASRGAKTILYTPPAVMKFFAPVTKEQSLMAAMRLRESVKFAIAMGCAMLFDHYAYFDKDYSFMTGPTVMCFLSGMTTSETSLSAAMRLFGTMLGCIIGFFFSNYADTPTKRTAAVCSVMVFLGFFRSGKKFGPAALYAGVMLNAMLGAPIVMNKAIARLTQVTFTILIYTVISLVVFPTQPSVILTKARIQTLRALGKTVEVIMKGYVKTVAASTAVITPVAAIAAGGGSAAKPSNLMVDESNNDVELGEVKKAHSCVTPTNEPFAEDGEDHRSVTAPAAGGYESSSSSSSSRCPSSEPSSSDDDDEETKDEAAREKRKLTAIDADGGIDFNEDCVPAVIDSTIFPQPSRAPVFVSDDNTITRMTSTRIGFDGTTSDAAAKKRSKRHQHARGGGDTSSQSAIGETAVDRATTQSTLPSSPMGPPPTTADSGAAAVVAIAPPPAPADPLLGVAGAVRMLEMLIAKTSAWVPLAEIEPSLSRIPYPATTSVEYHEVIVRMRSLLDIMVESLGMIRTAQAAAAEHNARWNPNNNTGDDCVAVDANRPFLAILEDLQPIAEQCGELFGSVAKRMADKLADASGHKRAVWQCTNALADADDDFDEDASLLSTAVRFEEQCLALHTQKSIASHQLVKLARMLYEKRMRGGGGGGGCVGSKDSLFHLPARSSPTPRIGLSNDGSEDCLSAIGGATEHSGPNHTSTTAGGDEGGLRAVLAANNGRFPTRVAEWTTAELNAMADALLAGHERRHHHHSRHSTTDVGAAKSPAMGPAPLVGTLTAHEDGLVSNMSISNASMMTGEGSVSPFLTDDYYYRHHGRHHHAASRMRMLATNADMVGIHTFSTALVLFGREVTRLLTIADSLGRYLLAAAAA